MTHSSPHWISRNASPHGDQLVTKWLFGMALLVAIMVVIGGVTRLTGSGLSMVEWRPLIGTLPPLNAAEWDRVYQLYQASPEYQQLNFGMSLAAFKNIFFWEYFHRLWGRLLGLAFGLPFLVFVIQRARAARVWIAAYFIIMSWRISGRCRLVDGQIRSDRTGQRFAISACLASCCCAGDFQPSDLDGF